MAQLVDQFRAEKTAFDADDAQETTESGQDQQE